MPTRSATVECSTCAAACCRLTVFVEADDRIDERLTTFTENGVRVMAKAEDGWCVAMDRDTFRCGIYAHRPDACRRFHMGGPYCLAVREDFEREQPEVMRARLVD